MKHFIRKSGSILLDADLYKAVPSETYTAPPMTISGQRPTKENIERYVWKMVNKHNVPQLYNTILNDINTESGFKQWRPSGKLLTSEAGAVGLGQLMPKTGEGLGVERKDWRGNLEGMVKLWGLNYGVGRKSGMSDADARRYGAMSYFSGGAGGVSPGANTSAVEKHNQSALASFRKRTGNPKATLWDLPADSLKGAPRTVVKYGGPKGNWYGGLAAAGRKHPAGVEKPFDLKLLGYSKNVEVGRGSRHKPQHSPVGESVAQARKFGLRGAKLRDPSSGQSVASVPVQQSAQRPVRSPPPRWSHAPSPTPASRIKPAGWRESQVVSKPVPSRQPAQTTPLRRSIKFDSELFVEE